MPDTPARSARPFRSVLYIPASKERALEKAQGLQTDAIIFDLEDAVAPDEKVAARDILKGCLTTGGYGRRAQIIRINGSDTIWGKDDLESLAAIGPEAILLPKVNSADDIAAVAAYLDTIPAAQATRIWAMMETPLGILNASAIAAAPRMAGFIMGTNDLAKDLGSRNRAAMHFALQSCLMAARAHGIVCIDGVYNAFKDEDGLHAECIEARDWGMDGKTLIHPAQLEIANRVFSPSDSEIDLARRQIAAYDEAIARGEAVAVVDGKIVENLHVETARATLAKAEAIAELEQQ